MTALTFRMPMPENIANARMHWRVKDKARKGYLAQLDFLQVAKRLPPPPATPFITARIASRMVLGNRMDHDNAMARHKWPLDWLQSRGYIANDRDLEWEGLPAQVVDRAGGRDGYRIELTLSPL